MKTTNSNSRRTFLGALALGTVAGGLSALTGKADAMPDDLKELPIYEADEWFKGVKGSHRIVYDGSTPHDGFPIIWNWAFYMTNNQTGSPDNDITGMTVLRHSAIPFAFENRIWEKYPIGEVFGIIDNGTKTASRRNLYYEPKPGDFPMPQIEGIKRLQERGAMFCVCDLAIHVYSGVVAKQLEMNPDEVYKDWISGVLPGIQLVPSGVWALGRAQELGCGYVFAGG